MRGIMTLLLIGGLSACQTTTATTKRKEPPAPIEISALISDYVAAIPGATGIPLLEPTLPQDYLECGQHDDL